MRLLADPPVPPGETHALAQYLRNRRNKTVELELSTRCDKTRLKGAVMRVNVTSTAVFLRVGSKEVMVPLEDVEGIVVA